MPSGSMPEGFPDASSLPEGFDFSGAPGGFTAPEGSGENASQEQAEAEAVPASDEDAAAEKQSWRDRMPQGMSGDFSPFGSEQNSSAASMSWLELGIYAMILLLAIALLSRVPNHNK